MVYQAKQRHRVKYDGREWARGILRAAIAEGESMSAARADLCFEFEEELETTVAARRNSSGKPVVWRVAKRGTVFEAEPAAAEVDWFKDLTHLYRDKTTGKKRGRREWATTFWVAGRRAQRLLRLLRWRGA